MRRKSRWQNLRLIWEIRQVPVKMEMVRVKMKMVIEDNSIIEEEKEAEAEETEEIEEIEEIEARIGEITGDLELPSRRMAMMRMMSSRSSAIKEIKEEEEVEEVMAENSTEEMIEVAMAVEEAVADLEEEIEDSVEENQIKMNLTFLAYQFIAFFNFSCNSKSFKNFYFKKMIKFMIVFVGIKIIENCCK